MRRVLAQKPLGDTFDLEQVAGFDAASRLASLTDSSGAPRMDAIDGVTCRMTRPVSHHDGHLTEVLRTDWGLIGAPLVQVTLTTTFPGHTRGWGLHSATTDRLFAASGSLCIVCYDARHGSPTFGAVNEFLLGARNQGLVIIPPGVYHGWKNVGDDEAAIISMPSQLYHHDAPDRWELAWDSPEARELIPYQWS
jgi:dTDP-4-dehydrorhamnose 3,5-epimerase